MEITEIIFEVKCGHCLKTIEKEEDIFCSQECKSKGYLYPEAHGSFDHIQDKKERRRMQALTSYYRNRRRKVKGTGRPRKDGSNLMSYSK